MNGIGVPGWADRNGGKHAADLTTVIAAVQDYMGQNLLRGHAARVAVGESERDRLRKLLLQNGIYIVEVPAVAFRRGRAQLSRLRRLVGVVARIAMRDAREMRRKDPRYDMDVVHQPQRGVTFIRVAARVETGELLQELIISPGLVDKQALQQDPGTHRSGSICVAVKCEYLVYILGRPGQDVYSHCKAGCTH